MKNPHAGSGRFAVTAAALASCCLFALGGCGQKGALYLPDHNPKQAVPASATPPATSAPADANAAPAPAPAAAPAADGTTTRKVPRDPDPSTAR